ncbi:MAG: hypothetical protein KDB27_14035 [Planctomycetales bacterium]|nr:hypothetical protein [Planctomycetales bacterium]
MPINDSRLVDVKISGKRFTPKTRVDVIGNAFVESSSHISVSELRAKVRLYGAQDMEPIELIVVFNVPPGASVATASMVPITVIPGPPIDIEDEIPF